MRKYRLRFYKALAFVLAGSQLGWILPAVAQTGPLRPVHIRVYVFNRATSSAVPGVTVHFAQNRTAPCPTGASGSAVTDVDGVAEINAEACAGPGTIFTHGSDVLSAGGVSTNVLTSRQSQFSSGADFIHIVSGQSSYLVRLPLVPTENNEGHGSEVRTVLIRVRGREANGTLAPVHSATIYDEHGKLVATTDSSGLGRAEISAPMGETVTMRADGGSKWRPASSSYIVGASEGGTRLTRADDYVNFVLKAKEENGSLTVEVLNHKTDQPIAGASVVLYKPDHFPGTLVASSTTSDAGEAHFGGSALGEADLNGETRIEASHKGYETAVQTVSGNVAHYVVYLKEKSGCDSIVGTWDWWNGLTVTFSEGGGASYRGAQSGRGHWMHLGGNNYDVHWGTSRTYDYFTLSSDGTKLEGKFDGKPGVSTRSCQ